MVGLLLLSHGEFSKYLLESASMLAGEAEQCKAVCLNKGESPQAFEKRVRNTLEEIDTGDGIIALVDMLGGTPYNTIGSLSRDYKIQIITGMNMPLIIYLTLERCENSDITDLVDKASQIGQDGIKVLRRK